MTSASPVMNLPYPAREDPQRGRVHHADTSSSLLLQGSCRFDCAYCALRNSRRDLSLTPMRLPASSLACRPGARRTASSSPPVSAMIRMR